MHAAAEARRRTAARIADIEGFSGKAMIAWAVLMAVGVVVEQAALQPTPPPTAAQLAVAEPRARADWTEAYGRLMARAHGVPVELGAVWTTRTGRICGVANVQEGGIDAMTRFYTTEGGGLLLRQDDPHRYFRDWMECVDTRWVRLHEGTERTGLCASVRGRVSVLGRAFCRPDGTPKPRPPMTSLPG